MMNLSNNIPIPSNDDDYLKKYGGIRRRKSNRIPKKNDYKARSFTRDEKVQNNVSPLNKVEEDGKDAVDTNNGLEIHENVVVDRVDEHVVVHEKDSAIGSQISDEVAEKKDIEVCDAEDIVQENHDHHVDEIQEAEIGEKCMRKSVVNFATVGLAKFHKNIVKPTFIPAPFYEPVVGEYIKEYQILSVLGKGSFGVVVRGRSDEGEDVAIKIIRKSNPFHARAEEEVQMLKYLNEIAYDNVGSKFIVRVKRNFLFKGHFCIVFELLSHTLLDLIRVTMNKPGVAPGLSLGMIHKLAFQLLRALSFLKESRVIHCDLKPENIALVAPDRAHIKVLDFGSSTYEDDLYLNKFPYIQSRYYRAPEILLGSTYSFPIDMWSLGCLLFELYTARPLFQGKNTLTQLYAIMDVIGFPSSNMIANGVFKEKFFFLNHSIYFPKYPGEFDWKNSTLWERLNVKPGNPAEVFSFYDLIYRMLRYSPDERITPDVALKHPFILQKFDDAPDNPDYQKSSINNN